MSHLFPFCSPLLSLFKSDAFISWGQRMFGDCLFFVITLWITDTGNSSAASAWRSTCLMHCLDIKRFQLAGKKVNHCLRNEVKRISPMWRRNWEGSNNTIMLKAIRFHFVLSSHVRMNLQNDIRGTCIWIFWAQTVCKGKLCPYIYSVWWMVNADSTAEPQRKKVFVNT